MYLPNSQRASSCKTEVDMPTKLTATILNILFALQTLQIKEIVKEPDLKGKKNLGKWKTEKIG